MEGFRNNRVVLADQVGHRLQQLHEVQLLLVSAGVVLALAETKNIYTNIECWMQRVGGACKYFLKLIQ